MAKHPFGVSLYKENNMAYAHENIDNEIVSNTLEEILRTGRGESMDLLYNKYGVKNVLMEPGDILFFNHLVAHSSTSNLTHMPRRAIVLQASSIFEKDNNVFEKFNKFRVKFVVDYLSKVVDKLQNKNFYKDFNKDESKDK